MTLPPLHCGYIAVTLRLHCRYIAVTLPLHYGDTQSSGYIAVTLPLHYGDTQSSRSLVREARTYISW